MVSIAYPDTGTNKRTWQVQHTTKFRDGIQAAVTAAGGLRALARLIGISHQAILQWDKVPAERLIEIEKLTGIARERLRPDLYRINKVVNKC
jgi:hypothetical protein